MNLEMHPLQIIIANYNCKGIAKLHFLYATCIDIRNYLSIHFLLKLNKIL